MDGLRPGNCCTRTRTRRWTRSGWRGLLERLEAHLDGLRVAGGEGLKIAEERYAEYPEAGELFVLRMLRPGSERLRVVDLDLAKVRGYLAAKLFGALAPYTSCRGGQSAGEWGTRGNVSPSKITTASVVKGDADSAFDGRSNNLARREA